MEIIIRPTAAAAACLAAELIGRQIRSKPDSVLGLATGSTMLGVYRWLVRMHTRQGLSFARCRTFNLDEYLGLAPDDPTSYHYFMRKHLFDRVDLKLGNTHLPDGVAADPAAAGAAYEKQIRKCGGIDLQLLGIGLNGHIGFNEPGSEFDSRTRVQTLALSTRRQNASHFSNPDRMPRRAITMGVGTILEARHCLLLATGEEKAMIVARALEGRVTTVVPGSVLQTHPRSTVVLDAAAASDLRKARRVTWAALIQLRRARGVDGQS